MITACARCSSKAAANDASVDSVQWSMLIRPSPRDRDRSLPNSASAPNSAAIHSASSTHFSEHLHAWRPRDKDRKDAGKFDNATAATSTRAVSIHHSLDEPPASGPSSASWLDHAPLRTMSCADLFGVMPLVPLASAFPFTCPGQRSFITSAFDEKSGRRGADGRRVTLLGKPLRVATCRAVLQRVVPAPAASAPAVAAGSTALVTLRALAFGFGCSGRATGQAEQNRQRHHRTQSHEAACKDQDVQKVRPIATLPFADTHAEVGLHTRARARTHTTRHDTHSTH